MLLPHILIYAKYSPTYQSPMVDINTLDLDENVGASTLKYFLIDRTYEMITNVIDKRNEIVLP